MKPMTPDFIARYNPFRDLKAPVRPRNVTIEQLLAAGCHLGHNKSSCHPAMKPFITGIHDQTHIINLDYTIAHLRRACTIVREVAFRHGIILIIGTRKGHKPILVSANRRMGASMLFRKWIPGTVTNGINVLFRGNLREELTPFKQYADNATKALMRDSLFGNAQTMKRFVFDPNEEKWIEANDEIPNPKNWIRQLVTPPPTNGEIGLSGEDAKTADLETISEMPSSTTDQSESIFQKARKRGDLAEWMAWDKFASIVQSVSDLWSNFILSPQQALPLGLSEYIPDHGDNWYKRQLEAEIAERDRRHTLSGETGDRSPLEMYQMDRFLARKGYTGTIRGEYIIDRVKTLQEDGLRTYPKVKVFRDGSTMIGHRRFDKTGVPLMQYSDGSYLVEHQVFDQEGKRYDPEEDALVFSDGSQLRFQGEGDDRKLVVVIENQVFDVTSTVAGSAEKREVLEKAADLLQQSNSASSPWTEDQYAMEALFKGSPNSIKFEVPILREASAKTLEEELLGEGMMMKGSEMLEISDNVDAKALDDLVEKSNRLSKRAEDLQNVTPLPPQQDSPFDNMYSTSTTTVRPDLIILLNPRENRLAIREATNHQIPTIGIIDTDSDPRWVTYAIPANDDSLRSVEYIMGVLSRAGEEGLLHRQHFAEQLSYLESRANTILEDFQADYVALTGITPDGYHEDGRSSFSVIEKYCEWYGLDQGKTSEVAITKIAANHIVMAQNEIKRLNQDTTGWSMQDFLDHVKMASRFIGLPEGKLQEMAATRMRISREVYYEEQEKPMQRRAREDERLEEQMSGKEASRDLEPVVGQTMEGPKEIVE
jgi:ribosomal protein S2